MRKKLAALTAVTSPESAGAGASTAHIFAGKQLEVRSVFRLNVNLIFCKLVAGRIGNERARPFGEQYGALC